MKDTDHAPRYQYDCRRCKFSWCCGTLCACILRDAPKAPKRVRQRVQREQRNWRHRIARAALALGGKAGEAK